MAQRSVKSPTNHASIYVLCDAQGN